MFGSTPIRGLALAVAAIAAPVSAQDKAEGPAATVTIRADEPGPQVHPDVFGQFMEHLGTGIYGGVWVGEDSPIPNDSGYRSDVLQALRDIKVPMVRWPGGCFADEYHWRDGIGAPENRPVKINTNWGGVNEDNSFGTHEFMGFAERLGARTYVSANIGSGTPAETSQWVEYMTAPADTTVLAKEREENGRREPWTVDYLGIGNELWGCGGNMRAEYAADVTNRFITFAKPGTGEMLKIASGPSDANYDWTEAMMKISGPHIDGLALHFYTRPRDEKWEDKGPALGFPESEWASTLDHTQQMDEYITRHSAIMDRYDPEKRVMLAVDEWGTWYDAAPGTNPGFLQQQNSLRDAMVAALNINIFTKHAERVKMAAIAQMVNVLQAMLLTDGPRMVKTPTYHVFDLYQPWQGADSLPVELDSPVYRMDDISIPAVSVSAVRGADGAFHVALVNVDPNAAHPVGLRLEGVDAARVTGRILTASQMDAHNTFDNPGTVAPEPFGGAKISGGAISVTLPPKSIVVLQLR
ncbi:alpha-N-arabinofuranosidase [Croceibacterium atlanticum]|nr:alpha-L-arabinofuranosidase C-terminal domain-containing protein [Croceibacterium atlanticum]